MGSRATILITMHGPEPFAGLCLCDACYAAHFVALEMPAYAAVEGYLVTQRRLPDDAHRPACEWCADPLGVERFKRMVGHPQQA